MTVRTWRERRTHSKHGEYILYADSRQKDGKTIVTYYVDCVRKGKTIRRTDE